MSELVAYAGGALLTLATIPQAVRVCRTRDVSQFAWSFVLMNAVGIALLAWRSAEIGETAFLLLNLTTVAFWALVVGVKTAAALKGARSRAPTNGGGGSAGVEI